MQNQESKLFDCADEYRSAREEKESIEQMLKEANAILEEKKQALIEAMQEAEVPSFSKSDGTRFSLEIKKLSSPIPETKSEMYRFLKEQGFEDLFTINSQTLQSNIKQWREDAIDPNNQEAQEFIEQLDVFLNVEERPNIKMTKSKKYH